MHKTWDVAGIYLAWRGERNPSAVAFGQLDGNVLVVGNVYPAIRGDDEVIETVQAHMPVVGVSIDAPLIITNDSGQRPCEKQLSAEYGARHASCHASNLRLYPKASSVRLSKRLSDLGFAHLGSADSPFQIECYPHPAIIEIFDLKKRLPYKKGTVTEKKKGQVRLAKLIRGLERSPVLKLTLKGEVRGYTEEDRFRALSGRALKDNEDALDSIICVYIAALYQVGVRHKIYGDLESGYIYVPQHRCI